MILKGKIIKNFQKKINEKHPNPNPAKIFNKACPEVIFANSRTDKLIIRDKLEIISIAIINGVINKGDPFGKKWFNIKIFELYKECNQIINKIYIEKNNVTISWAVIVCV